MDRLISEQRIIRVIRHIIRWMDCNDDKSEIIKHAEKQIKAIPSAESFKGMTNGEVIKAIFPYIEIKDDCKEFYSVNIETLPRDKSLNTIGFTKDWWDSPYKGEKE